MGPPRRHPFRRGVLRILLLASVLGGLFAWYQRGTAIGRRVADELRTQRRTVLLETAEPRSADQADGGLHGAADARQCPALVPGQAVDSVAFIHIPKTAGTFLHFALRSLMPQSGPGRWCKWGPGGDLPAVFNTCGGGDPGPDHVALFEATRAAFTRNCSGIVGHQDAAYFDAVGVDYGRTLTLTALRHPVERAISAYYYSLRVGASFVKGYAPANDTDFSGLLRFVRDNPARGNNLQTLMLAGARHCAWPGIAPAPPEGRWLAAAKQRLARVCVLVLAEFMDESLVRLAAAAGWPSERVLRLAAEQEAEYTAAQGGKHVNSTPKPKVPAEVRRVIEEANQLDMQLFSYAVQLFLRRSVLGGG